MLALALLAIPRVAAGASPSARLTYVRSIEAASCPDENALRKAVATRFGYDPFFPWAKKMIVVHLGHDAHGYAAHVELVDESGLTRGTRDLHADDDDCAQIFDATALAISIALDAFATSPSDTEATPTAPPTPPAPPPTAAPVAPESPPATAESTFPAVPVHAPTPVAAGFDALGLVGGAPGAAAGLAAFVNARAKATSVELRIHADASAPKSVGAVGRVETEHFVATVAPCALVRIVFACGIGEVGWLRAWGLDLDTLQSRTMPFIAVGARVGVALPVSDAVRFRIYVEGVFDLDRAWFQLDYHDAWTAPVAEAAVAIGFSHRIP
jgi:hypothetical protein